MVGAAPTDGGPINSATASSELPENANSVQNLRGKIWLVVSQYRQELNICRDLYEAGLTAYAPIQKVKAWRRDEGKWRYYDRLIFPWYIFVGDCERSEAQTFYAIRDTGRASMRESATPHAVIDQKRVRRELANFQIVYDSGLGNRLQRVMEFKPGFPCRVASGPLMGLEGYQIRRGKKSKIVISLSCLFAFGVASPRELEIDQDCLEPL